MSVVIGSRNRRLVKSKLYEANYKCAACSFRLSFENKYIIECHHRNLVSEGERVTSLGDLIVLCPTCHSIAHLQQPPMDLERIREVRMRATYE